MPALLHTRCHAPQRQLGGLEPQEHDFNTISRFFARSRVGARRSDRSACSRRRLAWGTAFIYIVRSVYPRRAAAAKVKKARCNLTLPRHAVI